MITLNNFVVVHRCGDCGENFVGEVRIVYCAGDDEGTDEAGVGGERLLTAKVVGTALHDAGEVVEEGTKLLGEGAADGRALAGDFGPRAAMGQPRPAPSRCFGVR